jgi:exonuclease VII large subunit
MVKSACKVALMAALLFLLDGAACQLAHCDETQQRSSPVIAIAKAEKADKVADWFQKYDSIRHEAQMSAQEKERSQTLLTQGLTASIFKSAQADQDKAAASALLRRMVDRYRRASLQLAQVGEISETRKLQRGYAQYFRTAGDLFSDYLKVQNNLFATDGNGNSIVGQMQQRKADLEALDAANKDLDARVRAKYHIAPYAFDVHQ